MLLRKYHGKCSTVVRGAEHLCMRAWNPGQSISSAYTKPPREGPAVEGEMGTLIPAAPYLRNSWRFRRRSVTVAKHADAALLRTCERACSSFVRPKRSERRSAVDRAFGRAKQARSTWPWSERWPVGASAAQKGASGARVCRTREGQHRIPLSRPKGGIAVISMFEPALASLSLKSLHWLALALRSQTPFSLMQVGGGNS